MDLLKCKTLSENINKYYVKLDKNNNTNFNI